MLVQITHEALVKLETFIQTCDIEISGLGRATLLDNPKRIVVTEIYDLPPQKCNAGHTSIDPEMYNKLYFEAVKNNTLRDGDFKLWWHSHVNFQAGFSGTDDQTAREFAENCGWMLSICGNKKREYAVRIDASEPFPVKLDHLKLVQLGHPEIIALETRFEKELQALQSKISKELDPQITSWKKEVEKKVEDTSKTIHLPLPGSLGYPNRPGFQVNEQLWRDKNVKVSDGRGNWVDYKPGFCAKCKNPEKMCTCLGNSARLDQQSNDVPFTKEGIEEALTKVGGKDDWCLECGDMYGMCRCPFFDSAIKSEVKDWVQELADMERETARTQQNGKKLSRREKKKLERSKKHGFCQ